MSIICHTIQSGLRRQYAKSSSSYFDTSSSQPAWRSSSPHQCKVAAAAFGCWSHAWSVVFRLSAVILPSFGMINLPSWTSHVCWTTAAAISGRVVGDGGRASSKPTCVVAWFADVLYKNLSRTPVVVTKQVTEVYGRSSRSKTLGICCRTAVCIDKWVYVLLLLMLQLNWPFRNLFKMCIVTETTGLDLRRPSSSWIVSGLNIFSNSVSTRKDRYWSTDLWAIHLMSTNAIFNRKNKNDKMTFLKPWLCLI